MSENDQITQGNTNTREMNCHAGRDNCQRTNELDELNTFNVTN